MMRFLRACLLIVLVGLMAVPTAFAAAADGEELDPVHHTADGYYLDFEPLGKVELPRIFLVRNAEGSLGLDFFGSTAAALRSGKYIPEVEHEVPAGEHITGAEAQTQASSEELISSGAHLDAHLVPAEGSIIIDFSMTRHLVFAIFASLLLILAFSRLAARYQRGVGRETAPKGLWQNLLETLIVFVRDDIAKPNLGDKYLKFLPFLLTVFFFILLCNLLGLVPFGATATSNLMITAVLAMFTFVLTQLNGSKDHWKHVFWPPGVPTFVKPILIPVEIMGLFTKPIALAIRLFANMTAGHLVILSLIGLIFTFNNLFGTYPAYGVAPVSIAFALFVSLLEILIAFIQAYIFTILSALFIGMATAEHEHEHDAHGHEVVGQASLPDLEDEGYHTPIIGDGSDAREAVPATPKLATAG